MSIRITLGLLVLLSPLAGMLWYDRQNVNWSDLAWMLGIAAWVGLGVWLLLGGLQT